jgi:hypothetical protein
MVEVIEDNTETPEVHSQVLLGIWIEQLWRHKDMFIQW